MRLAVSLVTTPCRVLGDAGLRLEETLQFGFPLEAPGGVAFQSLAIWAYDDTRVRMIASVRLWQCSYCVRIRLLSGRISG